MPLRSCPSQPSRHSSRFWAAVRACPHVGHRRGLQQLTVTAPVMSQVSAWLMASTPALTLHFVLSAQTWQRRKQSPFFTQLAPRDSGECQAPALPSRTPFPWTLGPRRSGASLPRQPCGEGCLPSDRVCNDGSVVCGVVSRSKSHWTRGPTFSSGDIGSHSLPLHRASRHTSHQDLVPVVGAMAASS